MIPQGTIHSQNMKVVWKEQYITNKATTDNNFRRGHVGVKEGTTSTAGIELFQLPLPHRSNPSNTHFHDPFNLGHKSKMIWMK